ncbi:NAD(P)-dependent oxidoreductase [Paenibacillus beijingensis]|uniref:NAD-dependent epimerase n=1 Tax=Paenibacillus beijingensis TaxID=1126833 RepID=A0A0D5NK31_9BACL|nr:SDR family oxidoreductase [Paenibacillus beijingensis]AJY75362.1 NAD-dependent epimerase [Paenibacillus beijingensis]
MNIVIFGANGPTGRLLTKQAVAEGHTVTAVTRRPETFPLRHDRLQVMGGDVFDLSSVEQAVAGKDAVLSTLGVPFSRKTITVYSEGIANIMRAMNEHGVRRLVCVTSSAVEPHYDPEGGFVFEKIVQPAITRTIGRTLYDDMRRMETLVKNSNLDWTIVRPSGLFETPTVTRYQVHEGHIKGRFTSRTDLADCMLQQLTHDKYLHKVAAVATVAVQPSMFKLIMKEAFQRRPS